VGSSPHWNCWDLLVATIAYTEEACYVIGVVSSVLAGSGILLDMPRLKTPIPPLRSLSWTPPSLLIAFLPTHAVSALLLTAHPKLLGYICPLHMPSLCLLNSLRVHYCILSCCPLRVRTCFRVPVACCPAGGAVPGSEIDLLRHRLLLSGPIQIDLWPVISSRRHGEIALKHIFRILWL
jgi:hypothetical protein